jgi:hypothetical protein
MSGMTTNGNGVAAASGGSAPLLLFLGVAAGVYAIALALVPRLPHWERAPVVAIGMTLDMLVVVPASFYFLLVRRRRWPLVTLAPVIVLSVLAASRVLPSEYQAPLRVAEALAIPLELGLLGFIAWRATRAIRTARADSSADPLERFRHAAFELTRSDRAAAILASEIAVLYYSLAAWRARPHVPAGATAVAHHRRSGHAEIVVVLLLVFAAEGIATHFLLASRSPLLAWILSIGTVYGALWIVADYRATVLRPILVTSEGLVVRAGFRCTLQVPRASIAGVGREKPAFGKESVNLTFLGSPTHWITLAEPVAAEGPYGFRRRVRAIGIAPDGEIDRIAGATGERTAP